MKRGLLWTLGFALVASSTAVGVLLDDEGQRTWALVSVIVLVGAAAVGSIYLAVNGLQRLEDLARTLLPRRLRRRR